MKRRPVLLFALALLAVTPPPTPLVVGSVRDQHGLPIEGASVRLRSSDGHVASALTAADGTFAVEAAGAVEASITCAFCRPTEAKIEGDGSVIAIITRYDAVASEQLSNDDVRHVPSSDAASTLALTPFAVLDQSARVLPGPQLTDRGVAEQGGLLIADAIPYYDIVANISPFYTIPRRYAGAVRTAPVRDAYVYDDAANNGTFFVDSSASGGAGFVGTSNGLGGALTDGWLQTAGAYSNDGDMHASRAVASARGGTRDVVADAAVASSAGGVTDTTSSLDSSVTSARFFVGHATGIDAGISGWLDRGTYVTQGRSYSAQAGWSDVAAQLFVRSHAVVAPFAQFSFVQSTGWLHATPATGISANVAQSFGSVGFTATTPTFDALAQAGGTYADYKNGPVGPPVSYNLNDAALSATFHPSPHWSLESSLTKGYRLPTLLTEYASPALPDDSYSDRDRTLEATASYTDRSNIRVGFTALNRRTAGLDEGTTTSIGASIGWQITPQLSLRAWSLHVAPDILSKPAARFGVLPQASTPASTWLTYENNGTRLDVIWRRDLIDWSPSNHLDAAIYAPLTPHLQWFVSTERRLRATEVDAGIRF